MNYEPKNIIIAILILILAGIGVYRFFFYQPPVSYVPAAVDSESCITKDLGQVKPDQELCVDHPDLIPAKTYYSNGWKVVCCEKSE